MKSVKGKTALVTGASSGIGEAFAYALAAQGCQLVLTARSEDKLQRTAASIRAKHKVGVTVIPADLSDSRAPYALKQAIDARGLDVDLLVNNAGFGKWAPFLGEELAVYEEMLQVNINALVQLSHLLLPAMLARKSGGIINIASTGAFQPCPYIAVYCASKAFVLSFSEALYGEYREQGITVTAVCPGNTDTSFFDVAHARTEGMPSVSPEQVAREGLAAFAKARNYVVTGGFGNYMQSLSSRFLPRRTIIGIVAKMFRGRVSAG